MIREEHIEGNFLVFSDTDSEAGTYSQTAFHRKFGGMCAAIVFVAGKSPEENRIEVHIDADSEELLNNDDKAVAEFLLESSRLLSWAHRTFLTFREASESLYGVRHASLR